MFRQHMSASSMKGTSILALAAALGATAEQKNGHCNIIEVRLGVVRQLCVLLVCAGERVLDAGCTGCV
jgi:hypothetical protein